MRERARHPAGARFFLSDFGLMLFHMPPVITIEELRESLDALGASETVKAFKGKVIPSRLLRQFAESATEMEALFLALWPETPSAALDVLAESAAAGTLPPEVTAALVKHPRTPAESLQKLLGAGDGGTQALLAGSGRLAPELAEALLASPSPEVRCRLAANPVLPPALQAKLAEDSVPFVRTALLRRARLDPGALALLQHDGDLLVRAAAVAGARVDDAVLLEWADADDFYTQFFLLQREELPAKALESLCLSRNLAIQELALARRKSLSPDEAHGLGTHGSVAVRTAVASKPGLPPAVQERLAADAAPEVRLALAANPAVGADALWRLLDSGDHLVRRTLAQNPVLGEAELLELCDHAAEDPQLAKLLAARAGLTAEQKALLLAAGGEAVAYFMAMNGVAFDELDAELAEGWAAHAVPMLRAFAAGAHALPRSSLAKLAIDPVPEVRRALAANTALPERTAGFLVTDSDPETVARARKRLDAIEAGNVRRAEPAEPTVRQALKRIIKNAVGK